MLLELTNGKLMGAYLSKSLTDVPQFDDYGNQVGHIERDAWLSDGKAFLFSLPPEGVYGDAIKLPVRTSAHALYEYPSNSARSATPPRACAARRFVREDALLACAVRLTLVVRARAQMARTMALAPT